MKSNVSETQFVDQLSKYDSCDVSRVNLRAVYQYLTDLEDGLGEELEPDFGTLAISLCEYSLEDLQSEHPDRDLDTVDKVADAVSYDFLDNCYSDCVAIDGDTVVLFGLV